MAQGDTKKGGKMDNRCEKIGPKRYYLYKPNRCERIKGHEGECIFAPEIREYAENYQSAVICVINTEENKGKRWVIKAWNEGGCNFTAVDLYDVIVWVKKNTQILEILSNDSGN
jgi:hypothetical protein